MRLVVRGAFSRQLVPFLPEQPQTGINGQRLEQLSAACFDFSERSLQAAAPTIGAIRSHGFHRVGNRDDFSLQQYLLVL